jgi:hypothetical protein
VVQYINRTGIEREMKDKMGESLRVKLVSIIIFFLLSVIDGEAIDIFAISGWDETIDKNDLVTGVGSDLKGTYESPPNATVININASSSESWRVYVRRTSWDSNSTLYLKRTSNGSGLESIEGGTSYILIGTTDVQLFSGKGPRMSINLQYKLTGISIRIPVGTHSTTLIYTVEEIR